MKTYSVRVYRPGGSSTGYDEFQISAEDVEFEECGSIVFYDDDGEIIHCYPAGLTMFELTSDDE